VEGFSLLILPILPDLPAFPVFPAVLTWTMASRGMIFDIDGTLVDTNPSHVEAWRRAFKRFGLAVSTTDCAMVSDTGHLYADLDRALEIASLATAASE
jgi:phosphoglycolate phosphatase-like HAD superfamily hydrolase